MVLFYKKIANFLNIKMASQKAINIAVDEFCPNSTRHKK